MAPEVILYGGLPGKYDSANGGLATHASMFKTEKEAKLLVQTLVRAWGLIGAMNTRNALDPARDEKLSTRKDQKDRVLDMLVTHSLPRTVRHFIKPVGRARFKLSLWSCMFANE